MIPVDSYTYIVDYLKLLLCDSLIRPISIGLIFLCGNESTFYLISAEISATPKSARLKFEQPLNCGFVTGLQKPYKPLCGRRCRPLCPARGKQGNPSLSPAYFRTSRKTAVKPPIFRVCGQIRRVFSKLPDAEFLRAAVSVVLHNTALTLPQSGGLYSANCRCAFLPLV